MVEETATALRAVGLSYVLPSSILPIDAQFRFSDGSVEYRVLVGSDDEMWGALSESKRWKAVYLYATEGVEAEWNWEDPVEGLLKK